MGRAGPKKDSLWAIKDFYSPAHPSLSNLGPAHPWAIISWPSPAHPWATPLNKNFLCSIPHISHLKST